MKTLYIKPVWNGRFVVRDERGEPVIGWAGLWDLEYLMIFAKANGYELVTLPEDEPIIEVR